ncbi:MAG TPA: glycoside hydrolase family 9 protein [Chthonomonadaceae bacterium]|nr:glycoside hydrolase family 9 protein [Chthonomonadaceae bacterium]
MNQPLGLLVALLTAVPLSACSAQKITYPDHAVPRLEGVTVPGLPSVTGRIVVDQFGYLPTGDKVAIITNPVRGYNAGDTYRPGPELQVRKTPGGDIVLRGTPQPWNDGAVHADSGDQGWWFDFSSLREPGRYYIYDPSTRMRSPCFNIGPQVYKNVLRAAVRVYFYQRLSFDLKRPYAQSPWLMPSYMDQDRHARAVWAKEDPGMERDLHGGWMDAGDTDKYPPFNADTLSSLLYAYRANPGAFGDDFDIPESGNGLPDLLDEVKYQLDWLVRMQAPDGGVYVKMGSIDYGGARSKRYYGPEDTGATIATTMNFAHAARVYGTFPQWKAFADDLARRAEKGWRYYRTHPRTYHSDTGEIKAGIANRGPDEQDRLEAMAAVHLFALTGKPEYNAVIVRLAPRTRQLSEGIWSPYEAGMAEALTDYLALPGADADLCARIRTQLRNSAQSDRFAPPAQADLYRAWMNPEAYHWGSNTVRASFGFAALLAAQYGGLSPQEQFRLRQRAQDMLHSFHGVNPFSAVMLTNMSGLGAELSLKHIFHERYGFGTPFESNPPPGYVVGGANQSFGGQNGDRGGAVEWIKSQPRAKAYGDFNDGWPKNSWEISEPAIYYQAAYIRLLAGVLRGK